MIKKMMLVGFLGITLGFLPNPGWAAEGDLPVQPLVEITENPSQTGVFERIKGAIRKGSTWLRIQLLATDEELPLIREALHEAEHALEPPTIIEGTFWQEFILRRLEVVKHPINALDLRRAFQNIRRLARVSEDHESPWLRDTLMSSATMFGITHGGEFFTGVTQGVHHLAQFEFGQSLGWFGFALPGFYDFGCYIGQGLLMVRPTRVGFNYTRKAVVAIAGKGAEYLGVEQALNAVFEIQSAREILEKAIHSNSKRIDIELEIPNEALYRVHFRTPWKASVFSLEFSPTPKNELGLVSAVIDSRLLAQTSYADLKKAVGDMGWNVLGALRQIQKLINQNKVHLIREEKTFINSVEEEGSTLKISFRPNAVTIVPKRKLREHVLPSLIAAAKTCAAQVAGGTP